MDRSTGKDGFPGRTFLLTGSQSNRNTDTRLGGYDVPPSIAYEGLDGERH
jgi:hypothetical protein